MTLDGVAQAAGVSKGGLLYHFPSKESLLGALAQRYVESMEHCIEAAKSELERGDASRDLKACIVGMLAATRARRRWVRRCSRRRRTT